MSTDASASPSIGAESTVTRNFILDVLRGSAIIGLLFISIREFGGFTANEQTRYITSSHGGNYKLLAFVSFLFEAKMGALLAMVFGAGMILFIHKKNHPGGMSSADAHIRQQIWLVVLGLLSAFLIIWPDDILYPFGVMGIMLFAFWRLPAKSLFIAAFVCMLIYCGKLYWNYTEDRDDYKKYTAVLDAEKKFRSDSTTRAKDSIAFTKDTVNLRTKIAQVKLKDSLLRKKDTLTKKQQEEKDKWEGLVKSLKYDPGKTKAKNKSMRAGYSKIWFHVKDNIQNREAYGLYSIGMWDISSMMFLGMALLAIGFFHRRYTTSTYLLWGIALLVLGGLFAWFRLCNDQLRLEDYTRFTASHYIPYNLFVPVEQLLMAAGYASLIIGLLNIKLLQWKWKAMAAIGHMPLTSYLVQTFACAFMFYGYGLGYYGRLQQWELYAFIAEVILVQVVFSVFWLRYYKTGPLEWLLKCLVYWKKFPHEKQPVKELTVNVND